MNSDDNEQMSTQSNIESLLISKSTYIAQLFGYNSFSEFQMEEPKFHKSLCSKLFSEESIVIYCRDCMKIDTGIICLPCFLKGNHEGHSFIVKNSVNGFCDCGNDGFIDPKGFCCDHAQVNVKEIEGEKREEFINILTDLLVEVHEHVIEESDDEFCILINWFQSISKIGKIFANCVIEALDKKDTLNILLEKFLVVGTPNKIEAVGDLISSLVSNKNFIEPFGRAVMSNIVRYFKAVIADIENIKKFLPLTNLFFSIYREYLLLHPDFEEEYIKKIIEITKITQEFAIESINNQKEFEFPTFLLEFTVQFRFSLNIKNKDKLIYDFLDTILDKDFIITTSINDENEDKRIQELSYVYLLQEFLEEIFKNTDDLDLDLILNKFINYFQFIELNYSIIDGSPIIANHVPLLSLYYIVNSRGNAIDILRGKEVLLKYLIMNLVKNIVSNLFQAHNIIPGCFNLICHSMIIQFQLDTCLLMIKFIQICFKCYSNKNELISNILQTFGVFSKFMEEHENVIYFDFIYFISLIITSNNTKEELVQQQIASKILIKPKPFESFYNLFKAIDKIREEEIKEHIFSVSTQIQSGEILYKLKSPSCWNPISNFQNINKVLSKYSQYIAKYKDEIMPFRKVEFNSDNQELLKILFSSNLLAVEYIILLNKKFDETNHLILNLLLIASQIDQYLHKDMNQTNLPPIVVNSFQELQENIPTNNFTNLMSQKFIYMNNKPMSFRDLIGELGPIGKKYLCKMNFLIDSDEKVPELNQQQIRKNNIKMLKQKFLNNFETKIQNFVDKNEINSDLQNENSNEQEVCCVCQQAFEGEVPLYPMFLYNSSLSSLYDGDPSYAPFRFSICLHSIHHKCFRNECPLDKSFKNYFLPNLDDIDDLNQFNVKPIIFLFFNGISETNLQELIISLCSIIVTYEVLLRSDPCYLNNKKYYVLPRNLYLCIRELYKNGVELFDPDSDIQTSYFQKFIIDLIQDESKLPELIKKYASEFTGEDLILFLRRVRLSEHFILGNKSNVKLNWDYILSQETLCETYNIQNDKMDYKFSPFLLYQLPNKYFDLGKKFSCDYITNSKSYIFLDLFCGETFFMEDILSYYKERREDLILVMMLNKSHSSLFLIRIDDKRPIFTLYPLPFSIYQNFLGEPDYGFKLGFQLFLNEAKYEKLANDFLSGNINSYITRTTRNTFPLF